MHTKTRKNLILSAGISLMALLTTFSVAQTPPPSPTASPSETDRPYTIDSTIELGLRGLSVNGNDEKFRSDLNYRPGLRVFNSSFFIENNPKAGLNFFDRALITSSGWGADPQGSFRFNMDKAGMYKFDSNVRRVRYYNNLNNHAINWSVPFPVGSEHRFDTQHNFGDLDLTVFPESENFRLRFGYSYSDTNGPGFYTLRWRSDEYMVNQLVDNISHDFRFGVEGKLLGFNLGVNYGHRLFRDRHRFFNTSFNPGNSPAPPRTASPNSSTMDTGSRLMPVNGSTDYGSFFIQRSFAKKLDFTGRFIYSDSISKSHESDNYTGRNNNGNIVINNPIAGDARAKRPQTRADIGLTFRPVERFRISNTFTFDQFNTSGFESLRELLQQTTSSGGAVADTLTFSGAYRISSYRRFSDLIEADYQVNRMFAFNAGYRYTRRRIAQNAFSINLITNVPGTPDPETLSNTTHSVILGTRIKPTKDWSIFADFERGSADNVFTRLANYKYTNFRVRSIARLKTFTLNFSGLIRNNDGPGEVEPGENNVNSQVPPTSTLANTRTRYFSASVDYNPAANWTFSAGYTYNFVNADTDVLIQIGPPVIATSTWFFGKSKYYVRDNYFFFDVNVRPTKWMTVFASYRFDKDTGQGDQVTTRPQDIIASYPLQFHAPEVKLSFRLHRNIDWNVGYQYYSYRERQYVNPFATTSLSTTVGSTVPLGIAPQNYTAHMPYTSLTIYFGRSADR